MREVSDLYETCLRFLQNRRSSLALEAARQEAKANPDDGRSWEALGIAAWMAGNESEALHALETANTLTPLGAIAQVLMADCYVEQGRGELACVIYQHALYLPDCPIDLVMATAASLGRREHWQLALDACLILADRAPNSPHAYFGIAYYRDCMGAEPEELVPYLRRAHELAPGCWLARLNLVSVLARLRRWEQAHELLDGVDVGLLGQPFWIECLSAVAWAMGDDDLIERLRERAAELGIRQPVWGDLPCE